MLFSTVSLQRRQLNRSETLLTGKLKSKYDVVTGNKLSEVSQTLSELKEGVISIHMLFSCSVVSDSFVTPWTVARQAPLSVGFFMARIPEWVAISFSRGSPQPRDATCVSFIGRQGPYH